MSADYFLTDGARVVPAEFQRWERAHAVWQSLVLRSLCDDKHAELLAPSFRVYVDRLEADARAALYRASA